MAQIDTHLEVHVHLSKDDLERLLAAFKDRDPESWIKLRVVANSAEQGDPDLVRALFFTPNGFEESIIL